VKTGETTERTARAEPTAELFCATNLVIESGNDRRNAVSTFCCEVQGWLGAEEGRIHQVSQGRHPHTAGQLQNSRRSMRNAARECNGRGWTRRIRIGIASTIKKGEIYALSVGGVSSLKQGTRFTPRGYKREAG
jgi:hypothetical protein